MRFSFPSVDDCDMDRYWFLTWTTYGTWLPGDDRGFVSNVRDDIGPELRHNIPGTEFDAQQRGLWLTAKGQLKGKAVFLSAEHAATIVRQIQETASFRGWELLAIAIMSNHVHVVVGVEGDPEPERILRDFKSYSSRCLNKQFGRQPAGTWWTESGSRRKLPTYDAVGMAIAYTRDQTNPLIVWISPKWISELGERGA